MTFDLQKLDLKILAGGKKISDKSFKPFDDNVCEFIISLSGLIMRSKFAKKYTDLVALAFWCSKRNILKMKNSNKSNNFRIGHGLLFHITPSNVPTNFFYSLVFGLLSGNSNIVKVPSKNFYQTTIICDFINKLLNIKKFKKLSENISIISYQNEKFDKINSVLSSQCDFRIIWGGDRTIDTVREHRLKPLSNEITFGDRYSLSVMNLDKINSLSNEKIKKIVRLFYNDTYVADQNACSSPHFILWYGKKKRNMFWNELNNYILSKYKIPMNAITEKYNKYCIDMTKDYFLSGKIFSQSLYVIDLKKLPKNLDQLRGKWGYFYQYYTQDLKHFSKFINNKFQTLTYYGFDKKYFLNLIVDNNIKGIDRVVPIGSGLNMNLVWDGYDIINILSRIKYFE